ncbi:MAG: tripartite tricarboxylate transporter substrate binding protein [Betaproteobacteria bacterium]|nr:tripartite tricarboxylate transporter substrate binding protein [Betaproteobacteria bacterium]
MDTHRTRHRYPRAVALALALALAMDCALLSPAQAQSYPNRPLRLIVPFPPGGGNDILARAVGQRLAESINQQVIVDNRGGAGGMVGGQIAATAAPDGYTLFLGSLGSLAHNPALRTNNPYDPPRDFAAVTLLATSPFILVAHPSAPATVKDLLAAARAKPGVINYGSAGTGSSLHLTAELFKHATGINLTHIAYKGTAPAMTELMAGQVQVMFSTMPPALPQLKAGRLRALGVTGPARAKAAPEVPTVSEAGVPGFTVENWQGIVVPAKTPAAIIDYLRREIAKVLEQPSMIGVLAAQGLDAAQVPVSAPAEFDKRIREEIAKWRKLVQAANIRVD